MLSLGFICLLAGLIYYIFLYLERKFKEMSENMTKPKAFGTSVLIMKDGKVLAVARRNDPNQWGMPGGKVDPNETEEEAAVRECFEETGLRIWNLKEVLRRQVGSDTGVTFTCDWEGEPASQPGEPECKWQEPEILMVGIFGEYNTTLFKKLGIR